MPLRQIPLVGVQGLHQDNDDPGATADYRYYLNGYFEKTDSDEPSRKFAYIKRPGISNSFATFAASSNNYKIQGFHTSIDRTRQFMFGNNGSANKTYFYNGSAIVDGGAAPAASGSWTNTGPAMFTRLDGISYGSNAYHVVTDFTKGAAIDSSGVWTEFTDAGGVFAGLTKVTNLVGFDGYVFVGTNTNRLYNSDLNNAHAWTSTSYLTVPDTPGRLMWLARIRNLLVVFRDKSIEFFEDVGAPTPGSPLEARKQLNQKIGCLNRNTIQEVSDGIIFVGTSETGMARVYKIQNKDLQIVPISNRYLEQNLAMIPVNITAAAISVDAFATNALAAPAAGTAFMGQSQTFYIGGKEFYTLNVRDISSGNATYTQVYDNLLGIWTSWATSFVTAGTSDTYGFHATQAQPVAIAAITIMVFVDNTQSAAGAPPRLMFFDPTGPLSYDLKETATQNYYTFAWTSDQIDFGNRKRKFMDSVEIHYTGDSSATPSPSASTTLTLKYRDWDYNVTSGYVVSRTLSYDPGGGVRCIARKLGSFRKRSFTIILNAIVAMRLWAVEINYNQGETDQEG